MSERHRRWRQIAVMLGLVTLTVAASGDGGAVVDGLGHAGRRLGAAVRAAPAAVTRLARGRAVVVTMDVRGQNPGTSVARDVCLTLAAGPNASFECGDLRVVHALPSIRLRNAVSTPMLSYHTQHAHPYPIVAANVTISGTPTPTTVKARLSVRKTVGDTTFTPVDSATWPGSQWTTNGTTRHIALGYDALTDPTRIYTYRFEVLLDAATLAAASDTGSLVVVNRRQSAFGAGWSLLGYEQVFRQADSALLWVGGDGSTRRFAKVAEGKYKLLDQVWRPESIMAAGASNEFLERSVHGGGKVVFDDLGRESHTYAADLQTPASQFLYNNASTVSEIKQSTGRTLLTTLKLFYANPDSSGRLDSVLARGPSGSFSRKTTIITSGPTSFVVNGITDPNDHATTFGYTGTNLLHTRTDKRGNATTFTLDAVERMASVTQPLNATETAQTTFCAAEVHGMNRAGTCSDKSIEPFNVLADIDGPRPASDVLDSLRVWVNRFGAPELVRDAPGTLTQVQHGATGMPGHVTAVVERYGTASSFARTATFDARGNMTSTTEWNPLGDNRNATTNFVWHPRCDALTRITYPEGNFVSFGLDAIACLRMHQEDLRGAVSRVVFNYNDATTHAIPRLVTSVVHPDGGRDSLQYNILGNVEAVRTPLGFVTTFASDSIGRDTVVRSPISASQTQTARTTYDAMDRVLTSVSDGPAVSYTLPISGLGADTAAITSLTLTVTSTYDNEGNRTHTVSTSNGILTAPVDDDATFDKANRRLTQTTGSGPRSVTYDLGGNAISQEFGGSGQSVTQRFDGLNRVVERRVPERTLSHTRCSAYADGPLTFPVCNLDFPLYPNAPADGLTIPADTSRFVYDSGGHLVQADNRTARVRRTYFRNGALQTDTLRLGSWADPTVDTRTYVVGYAYDLNRRQPAGNRDFWSPRRLSEAYTRDGTRAPFRQRGQQATLIARNTSDYTAIARSSSPIPQSAAWRSTTRAPLRSTVTPRLTSRHGRDSACCRAEQVRRQPERADAQRPTRPSESSRYRRAMASARLSPATRIRLPRR